MVQLSTEKIEIDGKEYTLFINRKGLLTWEKIAKVVQESKKMRDKYLNTIEKEENDNPIEISDKDNPFEFVDDDMVEALEDDETKLKEIYIKFYWIALYENHKLPISEVKTLFEKAEEEYGLEQLIALASQMIEDINKDKSGKTPVKKLKALRPTA